LTLGVRAAETDREAEVVFLDGALQSLGQFHHDLKAPLWFVLRILAGCIEHPL
jgi:hypothetical protein